MGNRIWQYFKQSLLDDYDRWPVWLPVMFGCGSIAYFSLKFEPSYLHTILPFCISIALLAIFRKTSSFKHIFIILLMLTAGFLAAKYRAESIYHAKIPELEEPVTLSGNVEEITYSKDFPRYTLTNLRIDDFAPEQIPTRLRLSVRSWIKGNIAPGDRIITDAKLMPPPPPVLPGGYDFARYAYFKELGATGYAVKTFVRLKDGHKEERLNKLRYKIANKINPSEGELDYSKSRKSKLVLDETDQARAIAAALVTGDRSKVSETTKENMRASGLAHLLAISGLHLAMVAAVMFFSTRFLLTLNYKWSEVLPIKKYAAIAAIIGSFGYLLIAGAPVSAQRAFMMVSLILLAVVLDRGVTPLRSVAFAAFIILLFRPESIFMPGFQMSFMAVLCLISIYELLAKYFPRIFSLDTNHPKLKLFSKILIYPISIMITAVLAGLATAPFAAYHFNQFTSYGLLGNLLAMPVMTFIVMPFAVLGTLLMPLGSHEFAFNIMTWGVELITIVAAKISAIPGSLTIVKQFTTQVLCLMSFGLLWLFIWKNSWRILGLIPIIAAITLATQTPKPDILISENGKLYAVNIGGKLYLKSRRKTFTSEQWVKSWGQEEIPKIDKKDVYEVKGKTVSFNCAEADIVADIKAQGCKGNELTITLDNLKTLGAHAIYIEDGNIRSQNVAAQRGGRLWTD